MWFKSNWLANQIIKIRVGSSSVVCVSPTPVWPSGPMTNSYDKSNGNMQCLDRTLDPAASDMSNRCWNRCKDQLGSKEIKNGKVRACRTNKKNETEPSFEIFDI